MAAVSCQLECFAAFYEIFRSPVWLHSITYARVVRRGICSAAKCFVIQLLSEFLWGIPKKCTCIVEMFVIYLNEYLYQAVWQQERNFV